MTEKTFAELGLAEPLTRALDAQGYTHPTPIQAGTIPALLEGRDVLGLAQTGTGKTAAFALPILHLLSEQAKGRAKPHHPRALILAPTRELAIQIDESLTAYGANMKLTHTVIFGGVKQNAQVRKLKSGVDIIVATPGRFVDLMQQGFIRLHETGILVLDEADRMLDMGFIHDVKKIVNALPKKRHSLLFSATMPKQIEKLGAEVLHNPLRVEVTPKTVAVDRIDQHVLHVDGKRKRDLLLRLLDDADMERVIVFTRTKHGANRVAQILDKAGVKSDAIHGNKSQSARQASLGRFRDGKSRVLVATDIAARGIDIDDITHVVNYELPNEPENYVHRIGRTARAGRSGVAISFCDGSERSYLKSIEKLTRKPLGVMDPVPYLGQSAAEMPEETAPKPQGQRPPRRGNNNGKSANKSNGKGGPQKRGGHRPDGPATRGANRPGSRARKRQRTTAAAS